MSLHCYFDCQLSLFYHVIVNSKLFSYHLLGFERHAANFILANLHPSSVLQVCFLNVVFVVLLLMVVFFCLGRFNVVTVVFVCVVLDFLLFEGLGVCFPSLLLVRQGGFDEDK